MAWSWSHTDKAVIDAYFEIRKISRITLTEILAEWRMHERGIRDEDWSKEYPHVIHMIQFHNYSRDKLISAVWRKASAFQTCDNGGFLAWLCPYGCEEHKVPFGSRETRNSEFSEK